MPALTLKVLASLIQMHGPDATIQSDHKGIDAVLGNIRSRIAAEELVEHPTDVRFQRGFVKGPKFRRIFDRR